MTFIEVAKTGEIPAGALKHVEAGGKELCIANVGGKFYAFGDRCPHMNARLSMGTLRGTIVTCPMHASTFDVVTGKKISGPVEAKIEGADRLPPAFQAYMQRIGELMGPIRTYDLQTFPVRMDGQRVLVDV
jgi:nitrite reductase/ring-hydroxylating ferredoxin subunit